MAQNGRGRLSDDALTGFEGTGERKVELRGFFTAMMAGSLYAWDIAFMVGAHHTIFFYRIDEYVVVAAALLVGLLVVRRQVRVHGWLLAIFTPPAVLEVVRLSTPMKHPDGILGALLAVLYVINVVALPVVVWVVARLLAPEYFVLHGRRLKITVVVTILGVALAGYLAGRFNDRYLTCDDFTVTGLEPPKNCQQVDD